MCNVFVGGGGWHHIHHAVLPPLFTTTNVVRDFREWKLCARDGQKCRRAAHPFYVTLHIYIVNADFDAIHVCNV